MRIENKHLALKVRSLPAEADGYLLLMCRSVPGETNEILATLVLPGQGRDPVHFRFFLEPEMRSFLGPLEDQREAILPERAGNQPNEARFMAATQVAEDASSTLSDPSNSGTS